MRFRRKTAEELTASMLGWVKGQTGKLTDFNIGSKVRTIIESVAVSMEELYHNVYNGIRNRIEENIYIAFEFPLLPAQHAEGTILIGRNTPAEQDFVIPIGTIVSTKETEIAPAIRFETTGTVTLLAGETTISARIRAEQAGKNGNVAENTIVEFLTKPLGIDWVNNPEKLVTGRNLETKDERKKRFREHFASRSRGTLQALEYGAMYEVDGVADAKAIESPKVWVFIDDGEKFIDVTSAANDPYEISVNLLPAVEEIDHALYIGALDKFSFIHAYLSTKGAGGGGVWEYYNGSSWEAIPSLVDDTNGFTQDGVIKYPTPEQWRDHSINSIWAFWVRFRITEANYSATPQIGHLFASPPPGFVELYVQDGKAEASSEMLQAVAEAVKAYRGAGVTVNVLPPTKAVIDIVCHIKVDRRYDKGEVRAKVEQTIIDFMGGFRLGESLILSRLANRIMSIEGGEAVENVEIQAPALDVLCSAGEIIVAGNITVVVIN